jgi:hypothetical protein
MNNEKIIKEKDIFKIEIEINALVQVGEIDEFYGCETGLYSIQKLIQVINFKIDDNEAINQIMEVIKKWNTPYSIT